MFRKYAELNNFNLTPTDVYETCYLQAMVCSSLFVDSNPCIHFRFKNRYHSLTVRIPICSLQQIWLVA